MALTPADGVRRAAAVGLAPAVAAGNPKAGSVGACDAPNGLGALDTKGTGAADPDMRVPAGKAGTPESGAPVGFIVPAIPAVPKGCTAAAPNGCTGIELAGRTKLVEVAGGRAS